MRVKTTIGLLIVLLILGVASLPVAQADSNKTFSWKYFAVVPATHPYGQIFNKHFANLEKRSNGRLKLEFVSWGESPYTGFDAMRVIRDGLVPTAEVIAAYVSGSEPRLAGSSLPYLLPHLEPDLLKFYKLSFGMLEKPSVQKIINEIFTTFRLVPLGVYGYGSQSYYSRVPITKPADFKGVKIRCFDPEYTDLFKSLGAVPTVISAPEVYTALQRGVVDAVVTQAQSMLSLKWGEVMKYAYTMPTRTPVTFFAVSKMHWDSLPPDLQALLKEEAAAAVQEGNEWAASDRAKTLQILKKDYGFTITDPTEADYQYIRDLAKKDVWPKWVDRAGAGAKEMLNACLEALGASERF